MVLDGSYIMSTTMSVKVFETIPNEITEHILSFTGNYSVIAAHVCPLWNALIKNEDKKISTNMCMNMAAGGHLEILKWLRDPKSTRRSTLLE